MIVRMEALVQVIGLFGREEEEMEEKEKEEGIDAHTHTRSNG